MSKMAAFATVALVLALAAGTSLADTHTWNVASGNWNVSGSWNIGIPSSGDDADIKRSSSSATIPSGYTANIRRVYVYYSGSTIVLNVNGNLTASGMVKVGYNSNGLGKVEHNSGNVTISNEDLILGDGGSSSYTTANGQYNLRSPGNLSCPNIRIGDRAAYGKITQYGGAISTNAITVGYGTNQACHCILGGGTTTCTGMTVTRGTLQVGKDATLDVNGAMSISSNGTFSAEIANGDCTYADVSGNVTLTSGCTLALSLIGGYEPGNHQEFTIIQSTGGGTISGNFTNVPTGWTTELRDSNTRLVAIAHVQTRAFPGAQGYGAYAVGGRGGDVYHVTNTNDSGGGSFRDGCYFSGASRTIVFDIGGTIALSSTLWVDPSLTSTQGLTIAGQTAPSDSGGICTRNYKMRPGSGTHDLVMRYIRVRLGDCPDGVTDAIDMRCTNSIVDHVSASWAKDECVSSQGTNITVQWSLISEGINDATHGYGSLIAPQANGARNSFHHNLYAHHLGRTPRAGAQNGANDFLLDYVNNVTYNWGTAGDWGCWGCVGAEYLNTNWVNNYAIAGPSTGAASYCNTVMNTSASGATCRVYHSGNLVDTDKDSSHDGIAVTNNNFKGGRTIVASAYTIPTANAITTTDANTAYQAVLAGVGATLPARDSRDTAVVNSVTNRNGAIITSTPAYPSLATGTAPTDTDSDGMPDSWENWYGTNPNTADNNGDLDSNDEYTNLERYLQYRVDPNSVTAGH
ncbi:MAG: hypothetical protein WC869_09350 [Phycisphaerae bacterium]